MFLKPPSKRQAELILSWALNSAIVGPFQQPFRWSKRSLKSLQEQLRLWLVSISGREAGFAYAKPRPFRVFEVGVTLLPEFRHQGFGTQVHKELIDEFAELCPTFIAHVLDTNIAEIRILRSLGFIIRDSLRVELNGDRGNLLTLRRESPICIKPPIVLILTGPPGAGKTAVAEIVERCLRERGFASNVFSVGGDMFSHLNSPWQDQADQLQVKYEAMHAVLAGLLRTSCSVVIDDIFQRREDYKSLCGFCSARGAMVMTFYLDAPMEVLLERNKNRFIREVLPDERVGLLNDRVRASLQVGEAKFLTNLDSANTAAISIIEELSRATLAQ